MGAALHLAGIYAREVGASVERIWENVLDWEHLPALHASSFAACERLDDGAAGWRLRLTTRGGLPQVIELAADRAGGRYVVTTTEGPGTATEIRVALTPRGPRETGVAVGFHVPEGDPVRRAMIGAAYVAAYRRLWDEDEAMMVVRERELAARETPATRDAVELGTEAAVRASLPLTAHWGGKRWRIIELDQVLVAHAAVCPHWLGPLDAAPVEGGCVTCPWHGYRFDVATGRSADGRGLRLATPPRVSIEGATVWLGG